MVKIVFYYNGYFYTRYPESKRRSDRVYFKRTQKNGKPLFLHRAIWQDHNGVIPKGCHIHHIDENPLNNDISNLTCITAKEHSSHHKLTGCALDKQLIHLERIRPMAKDWHKSEDGIKLHKSNAVYLLNRERDKKNCENCGALFECWSSKKTNKYCSNKCKSAQRRKLGLNLIDRNCGFCGCLFKTDKFKKVETCSRSCANRLRHKRKQDA